MYDPKRNFPKLILGKIKIVSGHKYSVNRVISIFYKVFTQVNIKSHPRIQLG